MLTQKHPEQMLCKHDSTVQGIKATYIPRASNSVPPGLSLRVARVQLCAHIWTILKPFPQQGHVPRKHDSRTAAPVP